MLSIAQLPAHLTLLSALHNRSVIGLAINSATTTQLVATLQSLKHAPTTVLTHWKAIRLDSSSTTAQLSVYVTTKLSAQLHLWASTQLAFLATQLSGWLPNMSSNSPTVHIAVKKTISNLTAELSQLRSASYRRSLIYKPRPTYRFSVTEQNACERIHDFRASRFLPR